ncbi:MAG: hypothetical protein GYB64_06400 [Chloroflexi bacterium]|nr:hypothetical protein [Chloroflexota bacterium]
MTDTIVTVGTTLALVVMVVLIIPCTYRVWAGPRPADRLQAIDLVTTLLTGMIVLVAVIERTPLFVDIGIALAAFAFIGTLAISRFIAEGKVF